MKLCSKSISYVLIMILSLAFFYSCGAELEKSDLSSNSKIQSLAAPEDPGIEPLMVTAKATCKNGTEITCTGSNCNGGDWDAENNYKGDAWCGCATGDEWKDCGQDAAIAQK